MSDQQKGGKVLGNESYVTDIGYKQELKRALKLRDLVIFGLLTVLPIAPIQVYGEISLGTGGLAPLVYVVGLVAMLFTALSYRQLAAEFPVTGASYNFVSRAINPHVGFMAGWIITVDYIIVPSVLVAFGASWANNLIPSIPYVAWMIVFIIIITFINARGITLTKFTDMVILILELVCVAVFLICAIKFTLVDGGGIGHLSIEPFVGKNPENINFQFIGQACTIALFGYLGFDGVTTLSEEVENPRRNIGRSIILTLCIIGACFILQSYFAQLAHPDYTNLDPVMAFFDISREVGGDFLYFFFVIVGIVGVGIANALVVQASTARVMFSMGRDKVMPFSKFLGKVHPRFQTPLNATLVAAVVILCVALANVGILLELVCFGALTTFLLVNLSVIIHFWFKKKCRGPGGVFHYLVLPIIAFIIIMYVWLQFGAPAYILGISWIVAGLIIGAVKSKGYKIIPDAMKNDAFR